MKTWLHILFLSLGFGSFAQHEFTKWYFGRYTGLDFMTNPPSVITHTTLYTFEGSASAADASGNLLFYTDGSTIWNQQQLVMANGTGLLGNGTTVQAALIVKQPGNSNIYYVFTLDAQGSPNGLRYSLVDMNLAAGMGSVTVKNATITAPCTEQLSGARHCNGVDMWIITHDLMTNNFKSFLLSASGLNLNPVISAIGPAPPSFTPNASVFGQGCIKISPNGKKLGLTFVNGSNNSVLALFDFDRSTGQVSNYLPLYIGSSNWWGCDFSGDGTKFYSAGNPGSGNGVYQWNLCAGSNALILASQLYIGATNGIGQLQLAPNGKIYMVNWNTQFLSTINNPNLLGLGCGYSPTVQSVATGSNGSGLPNFFGGAIKNLPSFTYTVNPPLSCGTASFTAPPNPTLDLGCGASGYPIQSVLWNFGQPSTGPANTSTLTNPVHNFGGPGIFPVKLVLHYQCGADTIYKNVTVPGPSITVNSSSVSCTTPGTATVSLTGAVGPFTYTWWPSAQTTPIATVNPGSYTVSINDSNGNCIYTHTTFIQVPVPLSGTVIALNTCFGTANGMASIALSMGTGGTGNYTYAWNNAQGTTSVSGLSAGVHTVTVIDANCILTKTFQINSWPLINLTLLSPTVPVCFANLQVIASGGNGPFSYLWSNGITSSSFSVSQPLSGTSVFTVNVTDINGCSKTASTQINFLATPSVSIKSHTICLNSMAVLTASGATSYTWFPGGVSGQSYSVSPNTTQLFTALGSFTSGCSVSSTATVTVVNCISVKENETNIPEIKIYPNPMSTELYIETSETLNVVLYDLSGRLVIRQKLLAGKNKISISILENGVYLLEADGEKHHTASKVLKID